MRKKLPLPGKKPHILATADSMGCINIPWGQEDAHMNAMARYAYRRWPHGRVSIELVPPSKGDCLSRAFVIVRGPNYGR